MVDAFLERAGVNLGRRLIGEAGFMRQIRHGRMSFARVTVVRGAILERTEAAQKCQLLH